MHLGLHASEDCQEAPLPAELPVSLAGCSSLRSLDLQYNWNAATAAQGLALLTQLTSLCVGHRPGAGGETSPDLGFLRELHALKHLSLPGLVMAQSETVVQAVRHLTGLQELQLPAGWLELQHLTSSSWLQALQLTKLVVGQLEHPDSWDEQQKAAQQAVRLPRALQRAASDGSSALPLAHLSICSSPPKLYCLYRLLQQAPQLQHVELPGILIELPAESQQQAAMAQQLKYVASRLGNLWGCNPGAIPASHAHTSARARASNGSSLLTADSASSIITRTSTRPPLKLCVRAGASPTEHQEQLSLLITMLYHFRSIHNLALQVLEPSGIPASPTAGLMFHAEAAEALVDNLPCLQHLEVARVSKDSLKVLAQLQNLQSLTCTSPIDPLTLQPVTAMAQLSSLTLRSTLPIKGSGEVAQVVASPLKHNDGGQKHQKSQSMTVMLPQLKLLKLKGLGPSGLPLADLHSFLKHAPELEGLEIDSHLVISIPACSASQQKGSHSTGAKHSTSDSGVGGGGLSSCFMACFGVDGTGGGSGSSSNRPRSASTMMQGPPVAMVAQQLRGVAARVAQLPPPAGVRFIFTGCAEVTPLLEGLQPLDPWMHHICLTLDHLASFTPAAAAALAKALPSLRELRITSCAALHGDALAALVRTGAARLRRLSICCCHGPNLSSQSLVAFQKLAPLVRVECSACPWWETQRGMQVLSMAREQAKAAAVTAAQNMRGS